jgi:hypothetical protein
LEQLKQAADLPDRFRLDFDSAKEIPADESSAPVRPVLKTSQRTVVSLQYGRFQARETIHQPSSAEERGTHRSAQLAQMVPRGASHAFDVIAHVGVETFLHGRNLEELQHALAEHQPALTIPMSTLWDQAQKFLFYLGHLQARAAPLLRQYLTAHPPVTWMVDGTCEPGTAVFLGVQEAASGILLSGRKIPSENALDIAPCLASAAARYGQPDRVLHDLGSGIKEACNEALPGVPQGVCHFHFARDIGEDLYQEPQNALSKRLRSLKLQFRLHEQRRWQYRWLRERPERLQFILEALWQGRSIEVPFGQTLGREALLAIHFWILDYASDGRRQGFPFDPHLLYLHRRLTRAAAMLDRLLADADVVRQAPQPLFHLQAQLRQYGQDTQIREAATQYERAFAIFTRLRQALRMSAGKEDTLREPYVLPAGQEAEFKTGLVRFREELRQESGSPDGSPARIVLKHLDKYAEFLLPKTPAVKDGTLERTTNKLERNWGSQKRGRRRTHGRGKLTRDFQALPEEFVLVSNLDNPVYVDLVLGGSLEALPSKLAEASQDAGSFDAWRRARHPRMLGQLPRRILRQDNFLDHLFDVCKDSCQTTLPAA